MFNEAVVLSLLGDALLAGGHAAKARAAWRRALALFTQLHHPDAAQVREKLTS